jgi:hypothetical protein
VCSHALQTNQVVGDVTKRVGSNDQCRKAVQLSELHDKALLGEGAPNLDAPSM